MVTALPVLGVEMERSIQPPGEGCGLCSCKNRIRRICYYEVAQLRVKLRPHP
jgi:hypothetical protein